MESLPSKMYTERGINGIEQNVETLTKIISGEIPAWEVSESERNEILSVEAGLALRLEPIFMIKTPNVTFDTAYLLTPEGKADFVGVVGIDIPADIDDSSTLKTFLYTSSDVLAKTDNMSLSGLGGRARTYRAKEIFKSVSSTLDDSGTVDMSLVPESDSIRIQLNPDLDYGKEVQLRELKEQIKRERQALSQEEVSGDYFQILDGIYELYQRRINELIAERAEVLHSFQNKAEHIGVDNLSVVEQLALQENVVSSESERSLSRYDKFIYGAGELDEAGWRKQISAELLAYAEEKEQENTEIVKNKEAGILAKGLDSEKISANNIPVEVVEQKCLDTLSHYDLLSIEPASTYQPDRSGAASDGKWQVIVSDAYTGLAVNGTQRVIKCPNKPQSVDTLLSVTIAHEIEGHVLQHTNRANLPLNLFAKIGSDRSVIFAEAGAMDNQKKVAQEAFGYTSLNNPRYIKAMSTKLSGGSYSDCVKVYYESSIKGCLEQLKNNEIDQETFIKECKKKLRTAISSTSRLFSGDLSSQDTSGHLIKSKDTVYLEQLHLVDALKEAGLDELLYLTRVNFSTLEFLLRAKMLNLDDIKKPDFYSLKLWEEMKEDYQLENEGI